MFYLQNSIVIVTDKKIQSTKKMMSFIKWATLFFLWLSWVFFVTTAFNIAPIAPNAIQYIKTIFLTTDGSNASATGIILEWSWGDGRFKNSVTINNLPNVVVVGTNASGKLISSTSGAVYNFISGFIVNWWPQGIQWNTWARWATWAILAHERSWTTWLRFQLPNGEREPSFINLLWPIGNTWAMWASWYAVVINIIQTWAEWTNGQCVNTGNIIGFYADKNYDLAYTPGTDTLLWSTIMCSDWATWPQWNTWATWIQWIQWVQGIQWPQWIQGNTWVTWATWIQWLQWIQWLIGLTWPQWIQGNTWATGIQWLQWIQGIQGIQGNTWATWVQWIQWNTWATWAKWVTGAVWEEGVKWNTWVTWATWIQWIQGIQWIQWNTWVTWFLQAGITWATPFWNGLSRTTTSTNIFNNWWYVGIGGIIVPKAPLQVMGNFIAGNMNNDIAITSVYSSIWWWTGNFINAVWYGNSIVGGESNLMQYGYTWYTWTNIYNSTILWWYNNKIAGILDPLYKDVYTGAIYSSFAVGSGAQVVHTNTFVRNSSTWTFTSGRPYSFLINAPYSSVDKSPGFGWVGINTRFPNAALDVNGDIRWSWNLTISLNIQANTMDAISSISTQTMKLLTNLITGGAACPEAGVITYNWTSFYGCTSSYVRKQLDN